MSTLAETLAYYHTLNGTTDPTEALEKGQRAGEMLAQIPGSMAGFAYAPGKWTVAQLLQHMIDTERILTYRALRFARGDKTPLAGF